MFRLGSGKPFLILKENWYANYPRLIFLCCYAKSRNSYACFDFQLINKGSAPGILDENTTRFCTQNQSWWCWWSVWIFVRPKSGVPGVECNCWMKDRSPRTHETPKLLTVMSMHYLLEQSYCGDWQPDRFLEYSEACKQSVRFAALIQLSCSFWSPFGEGIVYHVHL